MYIIFMWFHRHQIPMTNLLDDHLSSAFRLQCCLKLSYSFYLFIPSS